MSILDEVNSIWLEAQHNIEAEYVRQQIRIFKALIEAQRKEIDKLRLALPPGITAEEWEIIKELRSMDVKL